MEVKLEIKSDSANTYINGNKLTVEVSSEQDEARLTLDGRTITVSLSEVLYALKQPR